MFGRVRHENSFEMDARSAVKNRAAVELGRKGGQAKGRKGFAAMTPEKRESIRLLGLKARKAKKKLL